MRANVSRSIRVVPPTRELIVKLKADAPTRHAMRALASIDRRDVFAALAGLPRETAFMPSSSALETLLATGVVTSMEPLFEDALAARPGGSERFVLAMAAPPRQPELEGFHVLTFDNEQDCERAADALNTDAKVEYAYRPPERYLMSKGAAARRRAPVRRLDPLENRQWGLGAVRLYQAQKASGFKDAGDVTIAVIDTGVDGSHPDLAGVIAEEKNFTTGPDKDTKGHGTHVIGIIAAVRNNRVGISGVCQSRRILSLKALGPYNATGYYRAIRHAMAQKATVLNLSLGGAHDPTEETLIKAAIDAGVLVVAAMGNEFREGNPTSYPAAIEGVIAVGASTEVDRRASFSNTGPHIALVAPGENILSTVPTYASELAETTHYEAWPGTSMATPFVAAATALIRARRPKAGAAVIRKALTGSADKVGGQRAFTEQLGHGRLNVQRAVAVR